MMVQNNSGFGPGVFYEAGERLSIRGVELPRSVQYWNILLRPDGTFHEEFVVRIMMDLEYQGTGHWKLKGNTLSLKGVRKGIQDDGYHKGKINEPYDETFRTQGEDFVMDNSIGTKLTFKRVRFDFLTRAFF